MLISLSLRRGLGEVINDSGDLANKHKSKHSHFLEWKINLGLGEV